MKVRWKVKTERYSYGDDAFAGKWRVGAASYASCKSKDDPLKWSAYCFLPGIKKSALASYQTREEAKARVEKAVSFWMSGLDETNPPAPAIPL